MGRGGPLLLEIAPQNLSKIWPDRHQARLEKLCFPYGKDKRFEIHVSNL
jgi:hypothetical protein